MKKGVSVFAVIFAAAFIAGCQNGIESEPPEKEEVVIPKLLINTDKPFVLAEEQYLIEKRDVDTAMLNKYGYSQICVDGNYYFSEGTMGKRYYNSPGGEGETPIEKASIGVYDSGTGEYSVLFSEAPKDDDHGLDFIIVGLYDSFLYYYRNEFLVFAATGELELHRLNLKDKTTEKLYTSSNEGLRGPSEPIRSGDFLYFHEFYYTNLEKNEGTYRIYQCDMNTGRTSVFRADAEWPIPYKNGILYCHSGGYYYHGDPSDTIDTIDTMGTGIFYEGDELAFYPDPEGEPKLSGININGDTIIYTYNIYNKSYDSPLEMGNDLTSPDGYSSYAPRSVFGIFDEDFNRTDIASTPTTDDTWYINADSCDISETGLVSVSGASKPLIYDTDNECFAVISIDYPDYLSYVSEDSICFLGFDTDDNENYSSAALYTVKRK